MIPSDVAQVRWRKSSRSGANDSNCVEVAELSGALAVRDSKDPQGPVHLVDRGAWSSFVVGLRRGLHG